MLRGGKVGAIASAAKRLKSEGIEPTYAAVVAACPRAVINPGTQEPVHKSLVYRVFRECCYDEGANEPWDHLARLSRVALTEDAMQKRLAYAEHMLGLPRSAKWYYDNLVWCDLCNSLLPKTHKKATEMALARKGGKGWMSQGSQSSSQNLKQPKQVLKLHNTDTQ